MSKQPPFFPADILLPRVDNLTKWSVVACDQYTSEPQYWQDTENLVGDAPSTLRMVFPELYLHDSGFEQRIARINATMNDYLQRDIFRECPNSFIYVERTVANGLVRRGIVGKIDLLAYDYTKGSDSLIRATEGTVVERIPARVNIRENAPLELPHVMLLIDDADDSVIGSVADNKDTLTPLYDFSLMQGGGAIRGYQVPAKMHDTIHNALAALCEQQAFDNRYAISGRAPLLFAVGDGNHSLAAAKECYNRIAAGLSQEDALSHPARYALAELVNLHDASLEFEAIHRVVFDVNARQMLDALFGYYDCAYGSHCGQAFGFVTAERSGTVTIKNPKSNLAAGTLQAFLDNYVAHHGGRVDYIHGEDVLQRLAQQEDTVGFVLPCMKKSELFSTVILDGALPRKTFSMGEACEKRFYLEARKIR